MQNIHLEKKSETLINGNWVQTDETEKRDIDYEEFYKITSLKTRVFFQSLGGTEKLYYKNRKTTKLVSTNPDKNYRVIYNFSY